MQAFILAGAYCVVWSFCIWAVVLGFKKIATASKRKFLTTLWERFREVLAMCIGAITGAFALNFILDIAGVEYTLERSADAMPIVGAFIGVGAGAVAAKIHDAGLHRLEDFVRGKRD